MKKVLIAVSILLVFNAQANKTLLETIFNPRELALLLKEKDAHHSAEAVRTHLAGFTARPNQRQFQQLLDDLENHDSLINRDRLVTGLKTLLEKEARTLSGEEIDVALNLLRSLKNRHDRFAVLACSECLKGPGRLKRFGNLISRGNQIRGHESHGIRKEAFYISLFKGLSFWEDPEFLEFFIRKTEDLHNLEPAIKPDDSSPLEFAKNRWADLLEDIADQPENFRDMAEEAGLAVANLNALSSLSEALEQMLGEFWFDDPVFMEFIAKKVVLRLAQKDLQGHYKMIVHAYYFNTPLKDLGLGSVQINSVD